MIRKIRKKVGNRTYIINIPVIDIDVCDISSSGVYDVIILGLFRTIESNNSSRTTEDGLDRTLE